MEDRSLLAAAASDLRRSWKELVLTDLAYKLIAFVVLTPAIGILFRVLIAASGNAILTDQDILFFFLGPIGWICFVAVGALWLGIIALEQAALLGIVGAAAQQRRMGVAQALRFAAAKRRPVVLVAARLVVYALLIIAPFLLVAALVYRQLLTEFDINYYLKEWPGEFQLAAALSAVLVAVLAFLLLWLAASWFFALPVVLFEGVGHSNALRVSRERASGHRRRLLLWIGGWVLATTIVSALTTTLILFLGRLCVPYATGSPWLLLATVGGTLLLWAGVGLAVNLLSTIVFAVMLFRLYRQVGRSGRIALSQLNLTGATDEAGLLLTRKRLFGVAAASVVLAMAIGVFLIHSVRLDDKAVIMAHRGSSTVAPENTMAAVKQAIADGADWVEIDVQETADGEVVVTHDSDFMKQAGVGLKIWNATAADLENIDIGSWFDPKFKDERVAKLQDVLAECKGKIGVTIELKYYGHDERLEERVVEIVEAFDMASNVLVMSLKADAVKKMKSLRPNWKVGQLLSVSAGRLRNSEADFVAVNASYANRRFVRSVHRIGKKVYVWTVNDAPTMSAMMSRGVDGVITDKPALARAVLELRSTLSSAERVLLELAGILGVVPEIHDI
ncbi:MAG TPA: glycerophosphodiester phosphodiesterase [Lacipirellulaceae bacterium]|nr:glycerophosphodiester phosphodiesterase [Lacipirellulaceae bacterium]